MTFRIEALPPEPFASLFTLPDAELRLTGACRLQADEDPGYPCRVSLEDARIGEDVILVNYDHLPGSGPYAARHAILVRHGAVRADPSPGEVPDMLRRRDLSLRAFDDGRMLRHARLVEGKAVEGALADLLSLPDVAQVQIHFAAPGCYAARAMRWDAPARSARSALRP